MIDKPILDPCCGGRMFWFDKHNPHVLYCDNCSELFKYPGESGRTLDICPDMLCDVTVLPFESESFWHIVFDPPHMTRNGKNSRMGGIYGTLPEQWKEFLRDGFAECWRVQKPAER